MVVLTDLGLDFQNLLSRRVNVHEMKCLRIMVGVTQMDRVRNEDVRKGIVE